jgi:acyl carrier protein
MMEQKLRNLIQECTQNRVIGADIQLDQPVDVDGSSTGGGVEIDSIELVELLTGIEELTGADPDTVIGAVRDAPTFAELCSRVEALAAR